MNEKATMKVLMGRGSYRYEVSISVKFDTSTFVCIFKPLDGRKEFKEFYDFQSGRTIKDILKTHGYDQCYNCEVCS